MAAKNKFVVISDKAADTSWEESLTSSMGVCHTFKRAYDIGLFLSGITAPKLAYRVALAAVKKSGAVRLDSLKPHEPSAIIVYTKIY